MSDAGAVIHERFARGWRHRMLHRAAELIIVFVGVYAAFLLNSYYDQRKEDQRRVQLADWLIEDYTGILADVQKEAATLKRESDAFRADVASGKMPGLTVLIGATSDYDSNDKAMLLGSGALNLLKVSTLRQLTQVEQLMRQGVFLLRHDQQLSDTLILPHLGETPSPFFDPGTKQLRAEYSWYPQFFEREMAIERAIEPQIVRLIELLNAERGAGR
jgi:hypothetical protein